MRKNILVIGLLVIWGLSAHAYDGHFLAKITNDRNSDVSQIGLVTDSEFNLTGLHFQTQHNATRPPKVTSADFSLADIASGAVLDGDASHEVFVLQGHLQPRESSANLVVRYLNNGLLGKYGECKVDLRNHAGQWQMLNHYTGQLITEIVVRTWALGITTIENICPANFVME